MRLPEGISVDKQFRDGRVVYVVMTDGGEELGGISVSGSKGNTQLDPYLTEQQTRYSQDEKKQVVADVVQQMTDAFIMHEAKKPEHLRNTLVPPDVPPGTQVIEGKYFPCSKCNEIVARLIFSPTASTDEEMQELGKMFLQKESVSSGYPVWVIGAPEPDTPDNNAKHWTLLIYPTTGEAYLEHPDIMNDRLIALDEEHC